MPPLQNASVQWGAAQIYWDGVDSYSIEVPLHARGELATAFQHTLQGALREAAFDSPPQSEVRARDATSFSVVVSGLQAEGEEVHRLATAVQVALDEAYARTVAASDRMTSFIGSIHELPLTRLESLPKA